MRVETIVEQQKLDKKLGMKVGDSVRVKESVIVYHNPEHRSEAFDIKGMEGEILKIVTEWKGRPVSA
ncbi:MAG: ferredoxin-thioredoxin reductase variable chain, partial [Cyanobacteria bacterium J06639_18]